MRNSLIPNLVGLGLIATVILGVPPLHADDTARSREHAAALENPLAVHPLDEFTATRDRPLFTRSRRPPAAVHTLPVVAAPPVPPPPPKLALFGILLEDGEASAVVRGAPSEKTIRVRVGDDIDGWKVSKIAERQIVLSQNDRSITFTMFDGSRVGAPTDVNHMPPVLEVNAAGVLRAHRVTRIHH
jgi:general secretion pathway protein N